MKIEIKLIGLEVLAQAIHGAADKIAAAIDPKGARIKDGRSLRLNDSRKYPGTISASSLYKKHGITQRVQTAISKDNHFVNVGTANNPRWLLTDAEQILKIWGGK